MVGRGDRGRFSVRGEEDSGGVGVGVLIGVTGKLSELDKGVVAGIGVSGGDKRDERLGDEQVWSCVFPSSPEDEARSIV